MYEHLQNVYTFLLNDLENKFFFSSFLYIIFFEYGIYLKVIIPVGNYLLSIVKRTQLGIN